MKAHEFDEGFESGSDVLEYLDLMAAERPNQETKRVNVDFPKWMVESLDREARKLGVTRQSIIKVWLAQRIQTSVK